MRTPKETVQLVATRPHTYRGRRIKAGEPYFARPKDADLLVKIKRAKFAEALESILDAAETVIDAAATFSQTARVAAVAIDAIGVVADAVEKLVDKLDGDDEKDDATGPNDAPAEVRVPPARRPYRRRDMAAERTTSEE